jgi:hypothetical protein
MLYEHPHDLAVTPGCGEVKRRGASVVRGIHERSPFEQQSHHVSLPGRGRKRKGRAAAIVLGVYGQRVIVKEFRGRLNITASGRIMDRGGRDLQSAG